MLTKEENISRPADTLIENTAENFIGKLSLVANKQIKLWKVLLIIVFMAGFMSAIVWVGSNDQFAPSQAAFLNQAESLTIINGTQDHRTDTWNNSIDRKKSAALVRSDSNTTATVTYSFQGKETKTINKIRILADNGSSYRYKYWVREFSLQVSQDNQEYTSILDHAKKSGGDWEEYSFDAIEAKYIKLIMHTPNDRWTQIAELEVFTTDNQPTLLADNSYYLNHSSQNGQPLIIPPSSWVNNKTAKDLCNQIKSCDLVSKWDMARQTWISYTPGLEFSNFDLEPGRGYAVSVTQDTLIYISGIQTAQDMINMPRTSQAIDQYHFILPDNWIGKKASDLISQIANADSIFYYDVANNGWIGYVQGIPVNNFTLEKGVSYVVQISADTSWNPGS